MNAYCGKGDLEKYNKFGADEDEWDASDTALYDNNAQNISDISLILMLFWRMVLVVVRLSKVKKLFLYISMM